jgi:hypothetical protein
MLDFWTHICLIVTTNGLAICLAKMSSFLATRYSRSQTLTIVMKNCERYGNNAFFNVSPFQQNVAKCCKFVAFFWTFFWTFFQHFQEFAKCCKNYAHVFSSFFRKKECLWSPWSHHIISGNSLKDFSFLDIFKMSKKRIWTMGYFKQKTPCRIFTKFEYT